MGASGREPDLAPHIFSQIFQSYHRLGDRQVVDEKSLHLYQTKAIVGSDNAKLLLKFIARSQSGGNSMRSRNDNLLN
jgi:hypothetical protein